MKHLLIVITILAHVCVFADNEKKLEPLKQYEFPLRLGDNIFFCIQMYVDGKSQGSIIKPLEFIKTRQVDNKKSESAIICILPPKKEKDIIVYNTIFKNKYVTFKPKLKGSSITDIKWTSVFKIENGFEIDTRSVDSVKLQGLEITEDKTSVKGLKIYSIPIVKADNTLYVLKGYISKSMSTIESQVKLPEKYKDYFKKMDKIYNKKGD